MEIKRDIYLKQLIRLKDNGRIKIITGIRRCGKSYLLDPIYSNYLKLVGVHQSQIIKVSFEGDMNLELRDPIELGKYIRNQIIDKKKMYYVFIDEIQKVKPIKNPYIKNDADEITFVDVLLGLKNIKNVDVYVTGSNSVMLSTDVLTSFRDRGDEINVHPLSYKEFYSFKNDEDSWDDYIKYGGMPEAVLKQTVKEKSDYLKRLISDTYLKDIIERNQINNDEEILDELLNIISSSIGSYTNSTKLANSFESIKHVKISSYTVSKYINYFIQAFVLNKSYRYNIKGKKYIDTPLKYYFTDVGLRNARLNFRQTEESRLMENVIYNELLIRGFNVDVGVVEYNCKDKNNKNIRKQFEVDFVANKGNKTYYIQSTLNLDSKEKLEQETNSLKRINDSFKKVIISKTKPLFNYDDNGILYISLKDFLLNDDALDQ